MDRVDIASREAKITRIVEQYPDDASSYRYFQPKTSGGIRPITAPNEPLKKWLRNANSTVLELIGKFPDNMHGGISGRSHITHASNHVGKQCVITIDIRDCFGSMKSRETSKRIARVLSISQDVAENLVDHLTFRGRIAQGYPPSNLLSNVYLMPLMDMLDQELSPKGLNITNYVDDFAVSGDIAEPSATIEVVAKELSRAGLSVKKTKVEVMRSSRPQIICGLLVNKKISVPTEKKKELLRDLNRRRMDKSAAQGWIAHLEGVDPVFQKRFEVLAKKRKVL